MVARAFRGGLRGPVAHVAAGDPERQIPRDGVQHTATLAEFRRYDLYLVLQTRAFRALVE